MSTIIFLLWAIVTIVLVIGIIRPKLVLSKEALPEYINRKTILIIYGIPIVLLPFAAAFFDNGSWIIGSIFLLIIFAIIGRYIEKVEGIEKVNTNEEQNEKTSKLEEEISFIKSMGKNKTKYEDDILDGDIEIEYIDSKGQITTRIVDIDEVTPTYIKGYCHLRNQERTFKIDNILSLKDLTTGETYSDPREYFEDTDAFIEEDSLDEGHFNGLVENPYKIKDIHIKIKHYKFDKYFDIELLKIGYTKDNRLFVMGIDSNTEYFSTFYVDNILEVIDLQTGEVIKDVEEYFENLLFNSDDYNKELKRKEKEKTKQEQLEFLLKHDDLLKLLFHIAKIDGNVNAKEREILIETIYKITNKELDDKELKKIYRDYPILSTDKFKEIVEKVKNKYPNFNILKFAEDIIHTQKSVKPEEQEILDVLKEKKN